VVDTPFIDRMTERHAQTTGYQLVGLWHSHTSSNRRASPADEEVFRGWFRHGGGRPFVGLIVSKSSYSERDIWSGTWAEPVLTGHVVTLGSNGAAVISTAPVKVED
jgi:hypothetical protein